MFEGFTPETVDFLWGIRLNNERGWFLEHKDQYDRALYGPMKALSQQVFAAFQDVPNMDYKLSRIYRTPGSTRRRPIRRASGSACVRRTCPGASSRRCILKFGPRHTATALCSGGPRRRR